MNNFNINSIIEKSGIDPKVLASELFPENKYPMPALTRVVTGEALLNTSQLSKLSALTGIPIEELFDGGKWQGAASKDSDTMVFENGEYRAELNRKTWVTKIYAKNSIFHESVITDGESLAMSTYLSELDKIISDYK